ncbi:hypothetical protein GGR54DRAFT_620840 [Hypoxylon sp. NC1633]|nr:hypothetical protein GGR54DRAFT_620840 [Hypoxylon sp. NC1633]
MPLVGLEGCLRVGPLSHSLSPKVPYILYNYNISFDRRPAYSSSRIYPPDSLLTTISNIAAKYIDKMVGISAALASLLATSALASVEPVIGGMFARRATALEVRLGDVHDDALRRRQTDPLTTQDASNMTQWNTDTTAACMAALSSLTAASNPSGASVCYNLFSLDTNAGTFMADVRLFQISLPFGDFQGIPPQNIEVGLQYNGASASLSSQGVQAGGVAKRESSMPALLQSSMIVGQIDKERMAQPMTMDVLEALVMPTVILSAKNAIGQPVSTNVSANEAAFVNGIFSGYNIMSDLSRAALAVDIITAQMHNGTVAFVLPGVNILIFPVGLVLTSIWLLVGVSFYAFGTYERYNYRDTFRNRKARADSKPAYSRI